ncbi:MAG: hypothetical protein A2W80_14080 [Candidatus Riflebacteria bacterium GWC2_50_8]|nr:MAG: hypothetical protein A2W80_14080 [Candidatus Riflebacteria bacterium GWC2_50_8]
MRKVILMIFCLLLVQAPMPLWAGAYEQLVGMAGGSANVPNVPDPTPVDGYSQPSDYNPPPRYRYVDPAAEQRRAELREQRRKEREQARAKRARERKDEREDREWEQENRERKENEAKRQIVLKQLPPKWQLKTSTKKNAAASKVPALSGLSGLTSLQKQIDALQKQTGLTTEQQSQLADLDKKLFALWAQMVSANDTPEKVRKVLRLPVGFGDAAAQNVPKLSQNMLRDMLQEPADISTAAELSKDLMPVKNGLVNFAGDYLQNLIAAAPVDVFEAATDAELAGLMKDGLAVAKVTMAFRDKAKGIAAVADFVVGRIAVPQAAIAEAGRKIYSNVAFSALNDFMEKSSAAVGVNHDKTAFWDDLKQRSTTGQRAFLEWMGVK